MKVNFYCPHCKGAINAKNNIILSARTSSEKAGLILMHEEIGNYSVIMSSTLEVHPGEIVDFYCPICNVSLNTSMGEHYAKFTRKDERNKVTGIVVSRKYGDQCTFQIDEENKIQTYGQCLSRFVDPDWFK